MEWMILIAIGVVVYCLIEIHKLLEAILHHVSMSARERYMHDLKIDDPETYAGIRETEFFSKDE